MPFNTPFREATKRFKEGGGVNAGPLRKNHFLLKLEKKNIPTNNVATKLEGGNGLSGRATKKNFYVAGSLLTIAGFQLMPKMNYFDQRANC